MEGRLRAGLVVMVASKSMWLPLWSQQTSYLVIGFAGRQILFHGCDRWGVLGKRKFWQLTLMVRVDFASPSLNGGCTWMSLGCVNEGRTMKDNWDATGRSPLWSKSELNFLTASNFCLDLAALELFKVRREWGSPGTVYSMSRL